MSNDFDVHDVDDETIEYQEKDFVPPKRHTNFHIVLNTNLREHSLHSNMSDQIKAKLKSAAVSFAKNLWDYLILNNVNNPGSMNKVELPNRIITRNFQYKVEVSPKNQLIHLHIAILISHRALCVQIDSIGAKNFLRRSLDMPGAYFYCKTERKAGENLEDYMRKTLYTIDKSYKDI